MPTPLINISGQRRFKLTVLAYVGNALWNVKCDCGIEKLMSGSHFRRVKSCGCYLREFNVARNFKHGDATRAIKAPEYTCWLGIIRRCTDEGSRGYPWYGGRGIKICDRWRNDYSAFLEDMGRKPSPKHSIERIDNNGNYEPGNCEWATKVVQMRNRRNRRQINFFGHPISASEAAELVGINYKIFLERLDRGWTEERALLTPIMKPFGGIGAERFSHTDHAKSMIRVSAVVKAFSELNDDEKRIFHAAISDDDIAEAILRANMRTR